MSRAFNKLSEQCFCSGQRRTVLPKKQLYTCILNIPPLLNRKWRAFIVSCCAQVGLEFNLPHNLKSQLCNKRPVKSVYKPSHESERTVSSVIVYLWGPSMFIVIVTLCKKNLVFLQHSLVSRIGLQQCTGTKLKILQFPLKIRGLTFTDCKI